MRSKAVLVVAAMATALVSVPPTVAEAHQRFTFYGAGWGHGVGMSQWGAYGLAGKGWDARRILTHFYSGTRVETAGRHPNKIRIGLFQWSTVAHLEAEGSPVGLRIGSVHGPLVGRIPPGSTWVVGVRGGRFRVLDPDGRLVGGHAWGGSRMPLFVRYAGAGGTVRVPEAGHVYGRGWLELEVYPCSGCAMRLVAVVSPERYLFGLSEVPSSWPMAALEAQAVAARTYAFQKVAAIGQHRAGCDCGVYASTTDQVYAGWDKEIGADGERWRSAVVHTAGQIVTYRGAPIQAFYHSSSGGHTESNQHVWGGTPLPYLRGVCDPGDYTPANPNRTWSVSFTASGIGDRIDRSTGHDVGSAIRFVDTIRAPSGRILATTVVGTRGRSRVSGDTLASALGLRDTLVWIDENRNVRDPIRARYDALGCRPGLPAGPIVETPGGVRQRFAHGALYHANRPGRTFWLFGPVYDEYVAAHGSHGSLGMPRSDVERLRDPTGCRRARCVRALFAAGAIYVKTGAGRHELHGPVFAAFWSHGGAGKLGFPVSDVRRLKDGAHVARFESASVLCSPGGRCRVLPRG